MPNKCLATLLLIILIKLALILLLFILLLAYYDFSIWFSMWCRCTVFLCAMMRSVNTVTCGGLQHWTCASRDSCDTRDTGVVYNSVSEAARKPCVFVL